MTLSLVRDFAENIVMDFDLQDYNTIMDEFKSDPEVILIYMLIPYYVYVYRRVASINAC